MKYSKYQEDVFNFTVNGTGNAVVSAVAGSGKTTTLVKAIELVPNKDVLFLAFNKSIAKELKERIKLPNAEVKTVHGFGMSVLIKEYGMPQILAYKYSKLARDIVKVPDHIDNKVGYINRVVQLCDLARLNLELTEDEVAALAEKHTIEILNGECKQAVDLVMMGSQDVRTIDFTDMIFLPNYYKITTPTYDIVFVDECQDISACQRLLMQKAIRKGGRFIAVGDRHQCQPAGTKVLMNDGSEKNIEDVVVGDRVVGYREGFYGYYPNSTLYKRYSEVAPEVLECSDRIVGTNIIKIKAGKYSSSYTPNHLCMAKFNKNAVVKAYVLYLMESDNRFRVGLYPVYHQSGQDFGLRARGVAEEASKAWILQIYSNREEAYIMEQIFSCKHGIPQTRFKDNSLAIGGVLRLEQIWAGLFDTPLRNRAEMLLSDFNKHYDYPIWEAGVKGYVSKNAFRPFYACNLFPKYMDMAIFNESTFSPNKSKKAVSINIDSIQVSFEVTKVYSLKISREELYVADRILTHNSIYGFAGADTKSFTKLENLPNTVKLPLSVCYRCGSEIVKLAKTIMPQIEAHEGSKPGLVDRDASVKNIEDGDMVLCRQTYPLVRLCMQFLREGRKATIMGGDIGKNLVKLIEDTERKREEHTIQNMFNHLYADLDKLATTIAKRERITVEEARDTSTHKVAEEKVEVIELLAQGCDQVVDVVKKIETIFSDNMEGIILSTIHKSKGLESDKVYIIHEELMPSKYAKQDWEKEQERNLRYVAYTRAKSLLGFIGDFNAWEDQPQRTITTAVKPPSNFVGIVGEDMTLTLTVLTVKEITTSYGATMVYEMQDSQGNLFSKFGEINRKYIISQHDEIEEGTILQFSATIKKHNEFRGEKTTVLSYLSRA